MRSSFAPHRLILEMEVGLMYAGTHQRLLSLSELRHLWTWAALLLASLAAFASLIRSARHVILRLHRGKSIIAHSTPSFSSDEDDESCSLSSEDDDEEEKEEVLSSYEGEDGVEGYLCNYEGDEGQNGKTEEVLSWSDLFSGAVVKAWDGLGLEFDRAPEIVSPMSGCISEFMLSPAVVLSAAVADGHAAAAAVRAWDFRMPGSSAAAEWQPRQRRSVAAIGGSGDGRRVYVSDGVGAVAELDMRSVRAPVRETWWAADAAFGNGEDKTRRRVKLK